MSKSNNDPVIVTFAKHWRGYSPHEVAGFSQETADALVEGGVAALYDAKGLASSSKAAASTQKTGTRSLSMTRAKSATTAGAVDTSPVLPADDDPDDSLDEDGPPAGGQNPGDIDDDEKP